MKELFVLAGLLAIIIPISTYWGILTTKLAERGLAVDADVNAELCHSKHASNYPICGGLK